MTLGERIQSLRGKRTFLAFAKSTGVSHQTLFGVERGQSTKIDTLKRIAKACGVKDRDWADLLVLWIRTELGEEDFCRLEITPALGREDSRPKGEPTDVGQIILKEFFRLSNLDQAQLLKVMARPKVRACLPAINSVYDDPASVEGSVNLGSPEVIENIARRVQEGDILYSTISAPRGRIAPQARANSTPAKRR